MTLYGAAQQMPWENECREYPLDPVLGILRTRDGKTLADVEWEGLGMPKRVGIERLTKIMVSDR